MGSIAKPPHFDIAINTEFLLEEVVKCVTSSIRPEWKTECVNTKIFTAGTTNILVGCFLGDSLQSSEDVILVKIYGKGSELYICRDKEVQNMQLLFAHGCGSCVYGTFINGMLYDYKQGEMFTLEMVHEPRYSDLVAKEFARLHTIPMEIPEDFKDGIFDTIQRLFPLLPDAFNNPVLQEKYTAYFPNKADFINDFLDLKSKVLRNDMAVVYSHNDLFNKNIILDQDGDRVHFIDHEFGDFNYEGFDIGNYFNEFAGNEDVDYSRYPSVEFQMVFIRNYLAYVAQFRGNVSKVTNKEVECFYVLTCHFSLVSHILWTVWGLIQAYHSDIDFDFMGFAIARYAEYQRRRCERLSLRVDS